MSWELKKIKMDQNSQNIVLINVSGTTWPTYILMLFLSLFDILLDACIILQKGVDNFEIKHKKHGNLCSGHYIHDRHIGFLFAWFWKKNVTNKV